MKPILLGTAGLFLSFSSGVFAAPGVPPNFCQNDQGNSVVTNSNVRDGNWSDASMWSAGRVPTANDIVQIAANTDVSLNIPNAMAEVVCIKGKLSFSPTVNTQLNVSTIYVEPMGTLEVGTQATPVLADKSATIAFADQVPRITGDSTHPSDPEQFGTGLIAFGKVTVHGAVKTSFERFGPKRGPQPEPKAGDSTITLAQAVAGWRANDLLIIPDTRLLTDVIRQASDYKPHWENVTLSNDSSGQTANLIQPLLYDHPGARTGNQDEVLEYLGHVGNLTRNVIFKSQNPSGTRGHLIFIQRADVDIRYALLKDLGRTTFDPLDNTTFDLSGQQTHIGTNQMGRYALHLHHLYGPAITPANGYQYTLIGNAIDGGPNVHKFKWGITIHDSHYGLIQDNVVFNYGGAGLMMEDGSESFNVIDHNFILNVNGTGSREDAREGGTIREWGFEGAAFWFSNGNNYVRNNVAAYYYTAAYDYYPLGATTIPAFKGADKTIPGQSKPFSSNSTAVLQFDTNEMYGAGGGFIAWNMGASCCGEDNTIGESVIKNLIGWHIKGRYVWLYPVNKFTFDGTIFRGERTSLTNPNEPAIGFYLDDYLNANIVIRNSDLKNLQAGVSAPVKPGDTISGIHVRPFTIKDSYIQAYTGIVVGTPYAVTGGGWSIPPKNTIVQNVKWEPVAIQETHGPQRSITMSHIYCDDCGPPNINRLQVNAVLVYDYQGVSGNNFRVFFKEQHPEFIVPKTGAHIGSPVAGLTNAQNWAAYNPDGTPKTNPDAPGLAIAGGIAPCSGPLINQDVKDPNSCPNALSKPEIYGWAFPTVLPPLLSIASPRANEILSGTSVVVPFQTLGDTSQVSKVFLKLDNGPDIAQAGLNGSFTFTNVPVGQHTLTGWHVDGAGNPLPGTVSVTFRTTLNKAPVISLVGSLTIGISQPAVLNATVTDDGIPNGNLTFAWTSVTGPGSVTFSNPTSAKTNVTFGAVGDYRLRLTAFDGELSSNADILVKVSANPVASVPGTTGTRVFHPLKGEFATECFSEAGYVDGAIYNQKGSKVRSLNGNVEAGACISWNGRDEANVLMASGLYLFKATQAGIKILRKFLLIK